MATIWMMRVACGLILLLAVVCWMTPATEAAESGPVGPAFSGPSFVPAVSPVLAQTVTVWSCKKCNREIGRGDTEPNVSTCPGCGASLKGTPIWVYGIGGVVALVVGAIRWGLFSQK